MPINPPPPLRCLPTNVQNTELTEIEVELAKKHYHRMEGDLDAIAYYMQIPVDKLLANVSFSPFQFKKIPDPETTLSPNRLKPDYKWIKAIQNKSENPVSVPPCSHAGPCSEDTCSCIQNVSVDLT